MATITSRPDKNGKPRFTATIRLKGYPTQTATFSRKTDARKWVQDTESAIREGRHFKTTEAKKHTLAEMVDRYIKEVASTKLKDCNTGTYTKFWKSELGTYALADITPPMLAQCRDKLLVNAAPATVGRYLAGLSVIFNQAIKEWQWLEDSPMRKINKPSLPRGRTRFLSDTERDALLAACKLSRNKLLYMAVVTSLSTGMRRGEQLNLRWKDVNLKEGYLILHETKNGTVRRVALSGLCLQLLTHASKVRLLCTDLVFPSQPNPTQPANLRPAFDKALERAGIVDFHWHDLRHSCASYLIMNGASLNEVAEVLGHKTLIMVQRYAHLSDSHMSNVVSSMNSKIFGGA